MSRLTRDLARRLAAAGVDASTLAKKVSDLASCRAAAINREGLQAQIDFVLEAYGPCEIEAIALGSLPREERP
jgi:hypothetical protein